MAEREEDRIELLERRIAEKVTERVRAALFRLYAAVGVAVIGVLGFVSWDIVSEIKDDITHAIDKEVEPQRAKITEQVTETQLIAKRANQVIQRLEKQLDEFQPQAATLDETLEKVKDLKVTAQDLQAVYLQDVKALAFNVTSLANQLTVLAEQVQQLNSIAPAEAPGAADTPRQTPQQRAATVQTVIDDTKKAEELFIETRQKTTVFFQFAGGRREQAEALAAALKAKGFIVPGEDREGAAAGRHEVRYFHNDDKETAERLANETTAALRSLGYPERDALTVRAESFVAYRGKKPRPGIVELWLEIPPR